MTSVVISHTDKKVVVDETTKLVEVKSAGTVGPPGGTGEILEFTAATPTTIAVDSNGNSQAATASISEKAGHTTQQGRFQLNLGIPTGKSGVIQSLTITPTDGLEVDSGSPVTTAFGTITLGVNASSLRSHINVEDGATGDQTNAEIRTAVEAATDSNVFTDADHTKLNGIATGAEVNVQSDFNASSGDAFILNKPVVGDGGLTQNNFTNALKTKLDNIETSADVTDATNVDAAGAVMNSDTTTASMNFVVDEDNMSSDSATKLATQQSIKAYVDASVVGLLDYKGGYNAATDSPNIEASPSSLKKGDVYAVTHAGSFHSIDLEVGDVLLAEEDNPNAQSKWTVINKDLNAGSIKTSYESNSNTNAFTDALLTKLNGIETSATADQTGAEIKSLYEGESNTNAFTDALLTKLNGLETSADVTDTANVNSAGALMHTDIPDSDTGFVKRTGSETYDIDTSTYDPEGTGVAMAIALG